MTAATMSNWIAALGKAWEARDAETFSALFTDEADYYWTPFEAPKRGRREIAGAFTDAVSTQRGIRFGFELLDANAEYGLAHWWCAYERETTGAAVQIDGIMQVWLDRDGRCVEFREWWHKDEAGETGL